MSKDIIYREDVIEAIHGYWRGELSKMPMTDSEDGEVIDGDYNTLLKHNKELSTRIKSIPLADRPQLDKDVVEPIGNGNVIMSKDTYEELLADKPQREWILLEPRYPIEQKVYWNKEQALADTKGNGARERRKCSCCGYTKSFMCHMKDEQIKLWNFCPNCGAKMKGENNETN